jgi:hypothetical protein
VLAGGGTIWVLRRTPEALRWSFNSFFLISAFIFATRARWILGFSGQVLEVGLIAHLRTAWVLVLVQYSTSCDLERVTRPAGGVKPSPQSTFSGGRLLHAVMSRKRHFEPRCASLESRPRGEGPPGHLFPSEETRCLEHHGGAPVIAMLP